MRIQVPRKNTHLATKGLWKEQHTFSPAYHCKMQNKLRTHTHTRARARAHACTHARTHARTHAQREREQRQVGRRTARYTKEMRHESRAERTNRVCLPGAPLGALTLGRDDIYLKVAGRIALFLPSLGPGTSRNDSLADRERTRRGVWQNQLRDIAWQVFVMGGTTSHRKLLSMPLVFQAEFDLRRSDWLVLLGWLASRSYLCTTVSPIRSWTGSQCSPLSVGVMCSCFFGVFVFCFSALPSP